MKSGEIMKKLFTISVFSAICLFSTFTFATVVARGSLNEKLSLNTKALILDNIFSEIVIKVIPDTDSITVSVDLVAESEQKMAEYLRNWELRATGLDYIDLKVSPIRGSASNQCSKSMVNGEYISLKGVCIDKLVVSVPENLKPKISADKKMITFLAHESAPQNSTSVISSHDINLLISRLKKATFSADKEQVLQEFVEVQKSIGADRLLVHDLVSVIKINTFDDAKIAALSALAPFVTERLEAYQAIVGLLTFSSSKEQAKLILL